METKEYTRKPFKVQAVQVTEQNMTDVAIWCSSPIEETRPTPKQPETERYIKVNVHKPQNDRQTMAFAGDWILFAGSGYKVYTDKAFKSCFQPTVQHEVAVAPSDLRTAPAEISVKED